MDFYWGIPPLTGGFRSQNANGTESVPMPWRRLSWGLSVCVWVCVCVCACVWVCYYLLSACPAKCRECNYDAVTNRIECLQGACDEGFGLNNGRCDCTLNHKKEYIMTQTLLGLLPVTYVHKEVNTSFSKPPLKLNGGLAKLDLTPLVK